jgi:hypothetical protein|tara:strand:+ start:348 stop:1022 length:675 start_codon:yes stop_codon:yes gene_type:complete
MKLSDHTIEVLKNFATINQNLVIKEGSTLSTMSAMKNIVAKADVEESFDKEVAIYDLNEFLASISLFTSPILDFKEGFVTIKEENSPKNSLKYFYSDPSVVTSPSKTITMPSKEVSFTLNGENLNKLKRAAGVIQAPDLVLEKKDADVFLTVKDKKNDTANTFSVDVDTTTEGSNFKFYYKVENLKVMEGNYDVEISSKNISHLKSTNKAVEYWVALEPESSYE